MNKPQLIAHAKSYMDMLSKAIDPVSGEPVAQDSALTQPRLQKCFAYVSELLGELLQGNGFVALYPEDEGRYEVVEKKAPFALSDEGRRAMQVFNQPITPHAFLKNINRYVDERRMEKLSSTSVNAWLLSQGLVTETKEPATIRKTVRKPSHTAAAIGIYEQEIIDEITGESRKVMLFSPKAQEFLITHIDDIIACKQ